MFSSRDFIILVLRCRSVVTLYVNFRIQCGVEVQLYSLACRYPVAPAAFSEKTIPLETLAKNKLNENVRVCFWPLKAVQSV